MLSVANRNANPELAIAWNRRPQRAKARISGACRKWQMDCCSTTARPERLMEERVQKGEANLQAKENKQELDWGAS